MTENPRSERYLSHTLCELRKIKFLPLFCESAILFDMSDQGFKIEFTGEFSAKLKQTYWLSIPLVPLKIEGKKSLLLKVNCLWFDEKKYRMGGQFLDLSEENKIWIDKIIASLKQNRML